MATIPMYKDLKIDFKKQYPNPVFRVHQGDDGSWVIRIAFYDNGSRIDISSATAQFKATIANYIAVESEPATIVDNKVNITITADMTAFSGKLLIDVGLTSSEQTVWKTIIGTVDASCINETSYIDMDGNTWNSALDAETIARETADGELSDAITAEASARAAADANKANKNLDNVIDGSIKQRMIDDGQVGEDELTSALAAKINGKADKMSPAGTNDKILLSQNGGFTNSGIGIQGTINNTGAYVPTSGAVYAALQDKADKQTGVSNGRLAIFNNDVLQDGGKSLESYNSSATDYGLSNSDLKVPSSKIVKLNLDDKADTTDVQTALADKLETAPDGDNFLIKSNGKISNAYHDDDILGSLIFGGIIAAFDSDTKVATIGVSDAAKARLNLPESTNYIYYQLTDTALHNMYFKTVVNFVLNYNQYWTTDLVLCSPDQVFRIMVKRDGMTLTYCPFIPMSSAPPTGVVQASYPPGTIIIHNDNNDAIPYLVLKSSYNGSGFRHTYLNLITSEILN